MANLTSGSSFTAAYAIWTISYTQTGRTSTTATYNVTVKMNLTSGGSAYGYGYDVTVYARRSSVSGASLGSIQLKTASERYTNPWSKSFTIVANASAGSTTTETIYFTSSSSTDPDHGSNNSMDYSLHKALGRAGYTLPCSVFNSPPAWGITSSNTTLGGQSAAFLFNENTTSLTVAWSKACGDPNGNLAGHKIQRFVNGVANGAEQTVGPTTLSFTDTLPTKVCGTTYQYRIRGYDTNGLHSENIYTPIGTMNTFTQPTYSTSSSFSYMTTGTSNATINITDGGTNTKTDVQVAHRIDSVTVEGTTVTVYNGTVKASDGTTPLTFSLYYSGTAPSGPYVKYSEVQAALVDSKYKGTMAVTIKCNNSCMTTYYATVRIPVSLQSPPTAATGLTLGGALSSFGGMYYVVGRSVFTASFTSGTCPFNGTLYHTLEYSWDGSTWYNGGTVHPNDTITVVDRAGVFRYRIKTLSSATGLTSTSTPTSANVHTYSSPLITVASTNRTTTTFTAVVNIKLNTTITSAKVFNVVFNNKPSSTISATATGTFPNFTATINITGLTETDTFDTMLKAQDNSKFSDYYSYPSSPLIVPKYAPIVSISDYGVGINTVKTNDGYIATVSGSMFVGGPIGQNAGLLSTGSNFNNYLTEGEYRVGGNTYVNAPHTSPLYGKLIVKVSSGTIHDNSSNGIWQELIITENSYSRWFRSKTNNGDWTPWTHSSQIGHSSYEADILSKSKLKLNGVDVVSIKYGQYGECTRYYDGTQIMRAKQTVTVNTTGSSWGGLYNSGSISLADFIQTFTSVPAITFGVSPAGGYNAIIMQHNTKVPTTSNPGNVELTRGTAFASGTQFIISYVAIGRWK